MFSCYFFLLVSFWISLPDFLQTFGCKPPENVTISFKNFAGPMTEGDQYILQCSVLNVAPVQNLTVTFYRGQTAPHHRQSISEPEKKLVSETFTLNITASREHNGAHYWCEAKLELGSEGRQLCPVVTSEKINTTVYYGPELKVPTNPDPITITKGDTLHLNCSAIGNPSPSYTWNIPSNNPAFYSDGILAIKSVGFEHEGQYTCSVSSEAGTVTMSFYVDIQVNYILWIIIGTCVCLFLVVSYVGVFLYCNNRR